MKKKYKICIIGLGYVGLPLALEFSKYYTTIGFDIDSERINELKEFNDRTNEVDENILKKNIDKNKLILTDNDIDISESNIFIITVPTPVDKNKKPDLTPLISASKCVGKYLKKSDIVIYESTVYPGCTENDCVPVLEKYSKLKFNKDFYCGYSPERINPGDKVNTLTSITKVVSGSNSETLEVVDNIYSKIIRAGTYKVSSIKVAEAAKIIENSQRDINIAFVNELSKIFSLLEIDTYEVLNAAGTKWNFLSFQPGLVGGHCIGVDPYYLAQKALEVGYNPEIILSGRRINDSMGKHVCDLVIKNMIKSGFNIVNSKILIMGITFKENCPDIRNSRVVDIYNELIDYNCDVSIFDPYADKLNVKTEFGVDMTSELPNQKFDGVIIAVPHNEFKKINISSLQSKNAIVFDLKNIFSNKDFISL